MLASIQIAEHTGAEQLRPFDGLTKVFEDGVLLSMHLNYLLRFRWSHCWSRGGIPLIDEGRLSAQFGRFRRHGLPVTEVVSKAGAAVINKLPAEIK